MSTRIQSPVSDRIADVVWDAVREAINAGMTPQMFKSVAAEAWEHELHDDAKYAKQVLSNE